MYLQTLREQQIYDLGFKNHLTIQPAG